MEEFCQGVKVQGKKIKIWFRKIWFESRKKWNRFGDEIRISGSDGKIREADFNNSEESYLFAETVKRKVWNWSKKK
jgi:hypothetical protein